mgnify:FL=1
MTTDKQIISIPSNIWYVHNNGKLDSMWGKRQLAREKKAHLRNSGSKNITISRSTVTISNAVIDSHS